MSDFPPATGFFCPKCKRFMVPKPKEGIMVCKCGHSQKINIDSSASKAKTDQVNRVVPVLEQESSGLPTTRMKCPECGNNTAYWWLRQLRSADESEVRFFRCTKCGNTWREYD